MLSVKCKLKFWTSFTIICREAVGSIGNTNHRVESRKAAVWPPGVCAGHLPTTSCCTLLRQLDVSRVHHSSDTVTRLHLRHQVLWAGDVSAYTSHTIHGFKLLSLLPFSAPHNNDGDNNNNNNNDNRQGLYVINSLRPGLVLWIPIWLFFVLRRLDSAICRRLSSLQTMLTVECVSYSTVLMMKRKRKVRTIGKVGEGGSES
jgi:hypothetical protein